MCFIMTFSYLDFIELPHILPTPLSLVPSLPFTLADVLPPNNKASIYFHDIYTYHETLWCLPVFSTHSPSCSFLPSL